ncbi:hypothetical protein GOODEAATRI_009296, partial [Goodea atripinnis]
IVIETREALGVPTYIVKVLPFPERINILELLLHYVAVDELSSRPNDFRVLTEPLSNLVLSLTTATRGAGIMFVARSIAADHKDLIHDVSYDFHGRRMATCSSDQSVKIKRTTLVDSRTSVTDVKFAPKHMGLMLATCSADGVVRIYEAPDVMNLSQWSLQHEISCKLSCSCISSRAHPPMFAVGSDDSNVAYGIWTESGILGSTVCFSVSLRKGQLLCASQSQRVKANYMENWKCTGILKGDGSPLTGSSGQPTAMSVVVGSSVQNSQNILNGMSAGR